MVSVVSVGCVLIGMPWDVIPAKLSQCAFQCELKISSSVPFSLTNTLLYFLSQHDSLTHLERVQRVYVAISWIAFFVLLPSFIVICIVM